VIRHLLIFVIGVVSLFGHGLEISSASIVQRSVNHLSLSLYYNPLKLLQADGNIAKMAMLSNMKEKEYEKEYTKFQDFFKKHLFIKIGDQDMLSPHFRFSHEDEFKKALQDSFMEMMAQKSQKDENSSGHHYHPPSLYVKLDGFIPKDAKDKSLTVHFPKEIGEVAVSFSRPIMQTLQPDSNGSIFLYDLD